MRVESSQGANSLLTQDNYSKVSFELSTIVAMWIAPSLILFRSNAMCFNFSNLTVQITLKPSSPKPALFISKISRLDFNLSHSKKLIFFSTSYPIALSDNYNLLITTSLSVTNLWNTVKHSVTICLVRDTKQSDKSKVSICLLRKINDNICLNASGS